MRLSTSLVAVKKIKSPVSSSQFSEDELNRVAELILKVEGIINPLIIRRTSFESYEVVDGDFEYYAAAKAREIDPRKGEMISAFIIEPENEELITEQIKAFRSLKSDEPGRKELTVNLKQFESLPKQVENITEMLTQVTKELTVKLNKFENLPEQVENITEMLTQVAASVKKNEEIVPKPSKLKPKKSDPTVDLSKDYNSMKLEELKALASERNIKKRSSMNKAELITALNKADALS